MKKSIIRCALLLSVLIFLSSFSILAASAEGIHNANMIKVLIAFNDQPGNAEEALIRAFGGDVRYTYSLVPAIAASIPEAAISGLSRNPKIVRIEEDITVYAIGELDNSWGVLHIGSGEVHASGNTGSEVRVAVIDSGIDHKHPDLAANYAGGYDFANKDDDPMDDNGHGTHVAGTIAAAQNDSGVVGVAPDARVYALKVLRSDGSGNYSDIILALEWCVSNGIQITNNSYGSSADPGFTVKEAFDKSYAAGVIHIGSAGNSGNPAGKGDNVSYPAKYPTVIAVAATDKNDKRASFSSTGPDVELSAPGVSIMSTVPGGGYAIYSGTSMAAPHVAGTAALIISSGVSGVENIRDRLIQTAFDLGTTGKDNLYGYGLIDAKAAAMVTTNFPVVTIHTPANNQTFRVNESISFFATAVDFEDDDISENIIWSSNIKGDLGTGSSITSSLSEGIHEICAKAVDLDNNITNAYISITILNDAPVLSITSPNDNDVFSSGANITFEATAYDTEDGNISGYIVWSSSKDGDLGSGAKINKVLSDGVHIITAQAMDTNGKTGNDQITITIGSQSIPESIFFVDSVTYSTEGGRFATAHLRIFIGLLDNNGYPVPNASVKIDIKLNGSSYMSLSGTSDTGGIVSFKINNAPSGSYETLITDALATGLTWDGNTPANGYIKQ